MYAPRKREFNLGDPLKNPGSARRFCQLDGCHRRAMRFWRITYTGKQTECVKCCNAHGSTPERLGEWLPDWCGELFGEIIEITAITKLDWLIYEEEIGYELLKG